MFNQLLEIAKTGVERAIATVEERAIALSGLISVRAIADKIDRALFKSFRLN